MNKKEAIKEIEQLINKGIVLKTTTANLPRKSVEALETAIEALEKMDEIIRILDDTDFNNSESLNKIGEDKGYCEAIRAISLEVDGKYRWF